MIGSDKKIRALIAEDEALARNVIRKMLEDFPNVSIVAEASDGLMALNQIHELEPDLVFLDIQMPELDGLSLLKELEVLPMIVFTTAYQQYAIQAFDLHAVDYLLKPFDKLRFRLSMERIMMRHESVLFEKGKVDALTEEISKTPASSKSFWNRIIIKGKEGFTFIQVQDIYWIEAYSDYVKFHTKEKFYLKNISMTEVENNLPPENFIRIHRSTIVNRNIIQGLHPHLNGEYFVRLSNGQELKLSRSYKDKLPMLMEEKI